MKFRVIASSSWSVYYLRKTYPFLKDRAKIRRKKMTRPDGSSYIDKRCYIEIATLEELMDFIKACGRNIVILTGEENEIEIYDDYRE